jgi:dihydropteroate synthase
MGIVNVTPDSFSDGGLFAEAQAAIAHGLALAGEGADIIDVGGESTRPGSAPVSGEEELARVLPVVEALVGSVEIPVSIDTRHAAVASACVGAGATIINDVSGFRDPAMVAVAATCDAGLVVMHMLGDPQTMQAEPRYDDVVAEVRAYLLGRASELQSAGIAVERIALDPGIGFGKTTVHNLELLRRLGAYAADGYPLVVGVSRKRFLGEITGEPEPAGRLAGSLAAAVWSAWQGAHVLRVHDVRATVAALATTEAIGRRQP